MVESLGWFYALPMMAKTLVPPLYKRLTTWVRRLFVPPIATILTVDKLAPAETEEMVVSEQRVDLEGLTRPTRAPRLPGRGRVRRGAAAACAG